MYFRRHFDIPPRSRVPYRKCVLMWMDAFRATGNVPKEIKGPLKTVRTFENVERVRVSIQTGNHQMARIVRHNDESVREGYIRNGGKEVKLFTSALKAFQCNNRIVMAQRKHLDDFLRGRIIGRQECGRTQLEVSEELGIAQSVISRLW
ncbi:transposable element Tcb2 transposase [Trichonephila clavipes]|nr:transposable element Tcb2 transposase [Trichonephila clavipes]